MTPDAGPVAGTGQAREHARGGLPELLGLLNLEGIDTDLFRSRAAGVPGHRLFGGQVAAQALVAAERTAAGRGHIPCTPTSCGRATPASRWSTRWTGFMMGAPSAAGG
jgi:hypothetical protein